MDLRQMLSERGSAGPSINEPPPHPDETTN